MSKRLGYLFLLILVLATASLAALYAALHSQYVTPIVNHALSITHHNIDVEKAHYTPPFQFTLQGVNIAGEKPLYLPTAEVWLSAKLPQKQRWQMDALVIEGANVSLDQIQRLAELPFDTKQLAIKHSDMTWGALSARNVDVQIENPNWDAVSPIPYGNIQFASEQLYYRGQALNKVLLDIDYQAQDSTLYGASFEWNDAKISGQAEQYPRGWSLINVTISGLDLAAKPGELGWLKELAQRHWIADINSLDMLKSNIRYQGIELLNLDLSLEKIDPAKPFWQQEEGYLSFNADTLHYQGEQFIEPSATVLFTPQTINITELDTDWQQGRVQLQGQFKPDSVTLKTLTISGIKWLDIATNHLATFEQWGKQIKHLSIEQLDINNAQVIQLANKPFWQVSGLNIEGKQLLLKQQQQLGLWQGSLQLSANSASYAQYLTTQAIIELNSQENIWRLKRLFLPLENGYIEASGQWNKQLLSAPWLLDITVDGLPINQEISPLYFEGIADAHAQLNGLAGDYSMLAHSLSGKVVASLRESHITLNDEEKKALFSQDFQLDKLIITADRGRVSLESAPQTGAASVQLAGKVDLTKPELATLLLQSEVQCQRLQADLTNQVYRLSDICPQLTPQQSSLESSKAL